MAARNSGGAAMKIRHKPTRAQLAAAFRNDPITPEYQAEIDRTMEKTRVEYERAQRRLDAAERKLRRAHRQRNARNRKRQIAELEILVELRRAELEQIHRIMTATRAGSAATQRGLRSHRHVNIGGAL